jgi:hypothetical protein
MARGILDLIAKLPPIDFAALAERKREASRRVKKGDKIPRENIEKYRASRKRNHTERWKEQSRCVWREDKAAHTAAWRRGRMWFLDARILCAVEPGLWYATADIRDLSGVKYTSAKCKARLYLQLGWFERAENPDYAPTKYQKGVGIDRQPRGCDIKWLYRLTPAGEAKRASVAFMA